MKPTFALLIILAALAFIILAVLVAAVLPVS